MDDNAPLETHRFAIVSLDETDGLPGKLFDLCYAISVEDGGISLGVYSDLATCAAGGEWIADRLPDTLRAPLTP